MRFKKLTLVVAVLFAFAASPALAQDMDTQNVDTVILASTENYPDALMAASAANKIGVPILLTEQDSLPGETRQALERLSPSEVVVIGGTAVVSDSVVSTLQQDYNVTRLWGTTRYGTSVEVAENFWIEGAEEAILVQNGLDDDNGYVLAAAKELARDRDAPVYLTPEDSVPAIVQSSLQELGVQRVTVVGRSISDSYRSAITDLNITVEEEITGPSEDDVADRVRERVTEHLNASSTLLVVASESNEHAMAAANFPNAVVYHVTSDEETDGVVRVVQDHNISEIRVVGRPDLASSVADALRQDTDATVHHVSGGPREAVRMSANLTEGNIPSFARANRERMEAWRQERERKAEHVRIRANHTLQKAEDLIDENSSEEARESLAEARLHYSQGDYEDAWEEARGAINAHRESQYRDGRLTPAERERSVQEETEDLQKRIQELQRLNQRFAEELQDPNMTAEERLEIIEKFRHQRQEKVQALIEEAQQLRADGDLSDRLRKARERVRDRDGGNRFRSEIRCADEARTAYRITGHDGYVEAHGTVQLNNPNYDAKHRVSVDRNTSTVSVTVDFARRDTFGIECLAAAKTRSRVSVPAGNWTVDVTIEVAGDTVHEDSATVTVTPDEDDDVEKPEDGDDTGDETQPAPEVYETETSAPGTVKVQGHTGPHAGYVVVHRDDGGSPGAVVGHSGLVSDRFETQVRYNSTGSTVFWAMLHHDDGDGTYEFPGDDSPVRLGGSDGHIVMEQFEEGSSDTDDHVVAYSNEGFSPKRITVEQGDTVTWRSEGPSMWVASANHPSHTVYSGTSRSEHCADDTTAESRFDQCASGSTYSFTFTKTGEWNYHNHLNPGDAGTVVVEADDS